MSHDLIHTFFKKNDKKYFFNENFWTRWEQEDVKNKYSSIFRNWEREKVVEDDRQEFRQ